MTSSSGSMPPPYEAVIRKDNKNLGPIRLPLKDAGQFLEQFHRIYAGLGISIASSQESAEPETSGTD